MPRVDEKWITVPADVGDIQVRIVKPVGSRWSSPPVFYVHGGGWILGNSLYRGRTTATSMTRRATVLMRVAGR